jgi:hypothetical protein
MFDQLSPKILASLIKGLMPTATTTTKQNVNNLISTWKSAERSIPMFSQFERSATFNANGLPHPI